MFGFGHHAPFILSAYAITAAVIAGLIAWIVLDGRRQRALIADLESRGASRRSARTAERCS